MKINPANGLVMLENIYELTQWILEELDISVRDDGTIYRDNTDIEFNGLKIIANIDGNNIKYSGETQIELNLLENVRLTTVLFGNYIDNKIANGMPFMSYFPEEITDENDIKYSRLTIKFDNYTSLTSDYYHNKCLKFLDIIFKLEETMVDIHNFDTMEDK